jgi:hypothetical protein
VEGSCEHGNAPSGSINCWEVTEWLHNWWLLKKGSALCPIYLLGGDYCLYFREDDSC